jgi:hypothetical protein
MFRRGSSTVTVTSQPKAKAVRTKRERPDPPGEDHGEDAPGEGDEGPSDGRRSGRPRRKGGKPGGDLDDPDDGGDDGRSSSSSSSSSSKRSTSSRSRHRRHRKKIKEADSVKILALPKTAAQFLAWQNCVRDNVVSASGRSLKAYKWILEVEDPTKTYQQLALPGRRWETLDDKIRSALSAQLT